MTDNNDDPFERRRLADARARAALDACAEMDEQLEREQAARQARIAAERAAEKSSVSAAFRAEPPSRDVSYAERAEQARVWKGFVEQRIAAALKRQPNWSAVIGDLLGEESLRADRLIAAEARARKDGLGDLAGRLDDLCARFDGDVAAASELAALRQLVDQLAQRIVQLESRPASRELKIVS